MVRKTLPATASTKGSHAIAQRTEMPSDATVGLMLVLLGAGTAPGAGGAFGAPLAVG
jgi:hypothetical protein